MWLICFSSRNTLEGAVRDQVITRLAGAWGEKSYTSFTFTCKRLKTWAQCSSRALLWRPLSRHTGRNWWEGGWDAHSELGLLLGEGLSVSSHWTLNYSNSCLPSSPRNHCCCYTGTKLVYAFLPVDYFWVPKLLSLSQHRNIHLWSLSAGPRWAEIESIPSACLCD